jgi:transcriptional regulator with XRE-family HTH domain
MAGMSIGERVAELRKLRGMTQVKLAREANISKSLLHQVERSRKPASPSFTAAVARALQVRVIDLTEQPYDIGVTGPAGEQIAVPQLRQAIVEGDDAIIDTALRSIDDLRAAVARVRELDRLSRPADMATELTDTIRHLHATANTASRTDRPARMSLLSEAYCYAEVALYRLGHLDLAHLADERARNYAAAGDDPLQSAAADWHHGLVLMFDGNYESGLRTMDRGHVTIADAGDSPAARAIRGGLYLRAAVMHARLGDRDRAEDCMAEAQTLAEPGHDQANWYAMKFGPTNVRIHQIAIPVEMLDGTTAVSRARGFEPPADFAPSRVAHYWIDLAQGWLLHGDKPRALDSLYRARSVSPQLVRYHPQVRETVKSLAAAETRAVGTLSHFAAWCGVQG